MPESTPGAPQGVDRRGMDAAVIALIKQLHEDFVDTHSDVHVTFVAAHTREHEIAQDSHERALQISHETLRKAVEHLRDVINQNDRRYQERHEASQQAIVAGSKSVEARVAAAFEASEKAISVAAIAIEKKADATYVSLGQLQNRLTELLPKGEADQRFIALEASNAELRERVKGLEALKQGGKEAFSNVQMFAGIVLTLITIAAIIMSTR